MATVGEWKQAARYHGYRIFISSGDDAVALRDRVEDLIHKVFNAAFDDLGMPMMLVPVRWEQSAAQRMHTDQVIDRFIEKARDSHLVIVLLYDQLRHGTQMELEAVLPLDDVQLAIIQIGDLSTSPEGGELLKYLERLPRIFHRRVADDTCDESWHEILKPLLELVLRSYRSVDARGPYVEQY